MENLIWTKEQLAKELGTKEEFIKAQEKKVVEDIEIDVEKNWVVCQRCGIKEEGEERSVGDESYYLCDICNDDMNG